MSVLKKDFTFIDLFAGIGGFHYAMKEVSNGRAKCLFASEIDCFARRVYEHNHHIEPLGDINDIQPTELGFETPDVICAGFPCQSFSKGGKQKGLKEPRGILFRQITRIIKSYPEDDKPKILILENVQNLIHHDSGKTWETIKREIKDCDYNIIETPIVIAPKDVGVPQLRNRAIILAVRKDIYDGPINLEFKRKRVGETRFESILDDKSSEEALSRCAIEKYEKNVLLAWDEFIHIFPKKERVIGFPIWSDEFGSNYPLPDDMYDWKKEFIRKNRELYSKYKNEIDAWLKKWNVRETFTPTHRKFEWQAGSKIESIFDGIIQFRTSGVRVKEPTESPALVAMNHRPIYGPEERYITLLEATRLQSFPDDIDFSVESEEQAFKQLGNAVNVKVIATVFTKFVKYLNKQIKQRRRTDNGERTV